MNSYIFVPGGVSLYIDGKPMNAEESHPNYTKVVDAIREGRFEDIPNLLDVGSAITRFGNGIVEVVNGEVLYNGKPLRHYIVDHILNMMSQGFNIDPMIAYLTNLMQNPSKRAVDELHKFNEYGKMPITEDGCFIAYKRIYGWYDSHSRTVFNKPAHLMTEAERNMLPYTTERGVTVEIGEGGLTTVSMERNMVDDNAENTCSQGLHFCSQEYLRSFSGDKIVVLKINPAHVVSIPVDYNNTKGRCWKYQVIDVLSDEDFERALQTNIFTEAVYREEADDWIEDEEEEEEEPDTTCGGWSDYDNGISSDLPDDDYGYINSYRSDYEDDCDSIYQYVEQPGYDDGYEDDEGY